MMLLKALKKNSDILIALAIACAAGFAALKSYAEVWTVNRGAPLLRGIPKTSAEYFISQDDACVGSFRVSARRGKRPEISVDGSLRARFGGASSKISAAGTFAFNPLGQLIDGEGSISSGLGKISFSLKDPAPIKARVSAESAVLQFSRTFAVPGPILLRDEEADFEIEASSLDKKSAESAAAFIAYLLSSQKIGFIPSAQGQEPCRRKGYLQGVDALADGLSRAIPDLKTFSNFPGDLK